MNRLILMAAFGAVLMAQQPQPGAGAPDLRAFLNLTEQQMQTLQQLQRQQAQAAQPLAQQMQPLQQQLQQLLATENPDAAAVGRLMIDINGLQRKMQQITSDIQRQRLGLLGPEQQGKLQMLSQALQLQPLAQQALSQGLIEAPRPQQGPGPH